MQPVIVTAEVTSRQFDVSALASDTPIEVSVMVMGRRGPAGPSGGVGVESDPVFLASAAAGISAGDITNWNSKEVGGAAAAALSVAESYTDTQVAAAIVTANAYADSLASNYDPSGAAAAAIVTAGNYTDTQIAGLSSVYVAKNGAITGATKTKITYDAKGLVTAGADATTADIADSSNKRYVTDAQLVVIGNTSGVNTGDQSLSGLQPLDATLTALAGLTITANSLIYGTGADAFSILAQNTTATRKFLREVSSGAPAWDTLQAGDIPDLSATYYSTANPNNYAAITSSDNQIIFNLGDTYVGDAGLQYNHNDSQLLLADGTANKPAYAFVNDINTGMRYDGSGGLLFSASTSDAWGINSGRVLYPYIDGTDIGIADTNRVGTIYMSSNIDYVTNLNFQVGGVDKIVFDNTGAVILGEWKGTAIADTYIASASTWNAKQDALGFTAVPTTRTVNGQALSGDITISTISGNAGSATVLASSRNINGVAFNGSGDITVTAAAGTLTGTTLNSTVVTSSLTAVGTLANLTVTNTIVGSVNGNAATATALQNARTIGGVSFNGTANITVSTATAGFTVTGGTLTPVAGTTSLAAVTFPSGSLTTGANIAAGQVSYDGVNLYSVLDTTSAWGVIPVEQYFHLTADGGAITTIANFFGATSNISLVASAYYEIEIMLVFLKTTTEIPNVVLTNSAAPTSQNIRWEQSPIAGVTAPPGANTGRMGFTVKDATQALTIGAGSLTTAVNHYIKINIQLQNGTGTSLKIQMSNPAGSVTPRLGSYWRCRRMSPNNVGAFAA